MWLLTSRVQEARNLSSPIHDIPNHLEHVFSKFDLEKSSLQEGHIKNLYLAIAILNYEPKNVIYGFFTYTFGVISKNNLLVNLVMNLLPLKF